MTAEIMLQLAVQEITELQVILFVLSVEMWQFAIWGAPIFGDLSG